MQRGLFVYLAIFLLAFSLLLTQTYAQEDIPEIPQKVLNKHQDNEQDGSFDDPSHNNLKDKKEFPEDGSTKDSSINLEELEEEFTDEELEESLDPGLTPDSPFYFMDKWFDGEDSRAEKIAEIRAMIREGKTEEAREALKEYKKHAKEFGDNPDPEKRESARRDAAAIRHALKELDNIEFNDDFENILETEKEIVTAVEISSKIKSLCKQLDELGAYEEYEKVCKTSEDSPDWQRKLDKDLIDSQREEAIKFGKIMSQCMRTSGQDCNCEAIPHPEFAATCSIAAPLAKACDIENDEIACEQLDNLDMPELPDYLQDVMDDLDGQHNEDRYDHHIPQPCQEYFEENNIDPREDKNARDICFEIMVETEAPPECREAIKEAGATKEREAREICEKIMFEKEAPKECKERGITDHRECAKLFEKEFDRHGPNKDPDCRDLPDEERLKCYDDIASGAHSRFDRGDFEDRFRETKERERECANSCVNDQGKGRWDFSGGECRCEFRDDFREGRGFDNDRRRFEDHDDNFREGRGFEDHNNFENHDDNFREGRGFEDHNNFEDHDDNFNEGNFPDESNPNSESEGVPAPDGNEPSSEDSGSGSDSSNSGNSDSENRGSSNDGAPSSDGSEGGGSSGGDDSGSDGGPTGSVVFTGNAFLDYYYS